jgi:hypothetical protein
MISMSTENASRACGGPERIAVARVADVARDQAMALPEGEIRALLEELGFTLRRLALVHAVTS